MCWHHCKPSTSAALSAEENPFHFLHGNLSEFSFKLLWKYSGGKEIGIRVYIVKYLCICMFYTEITVGGDRPMRGQSPTIQIEQEVIIVPQG